MNVKSGNVEQFKSYSQFKNLQEFNAHIEMWLAVHKNKLTKGELVGLKRLIRKMKSAIEIKNHIAYFYGILHKKLEELYFEELFELGFSTEKEQISYVHFKRS